MDDGKTLRIALVGLNQTPMDWQGNFARIQEALKRARAAQVSLLCFPELALSGYGCEDAFLHPDVPARSLAQLKQLAALCGREVMLVGLPFSFEGHLYNGVAVLNEGHIRGIALKSHLAKDGIHYEPRWFRAWPAGKVSSVHIDGESVPVGALIYDVLGLPFAMEICEDAWVSPEERPCRFVQEAAWIFNCSASHFSMRKADIRESLVRESSRRFGVGYAYANLVGCESGRAIYDGELLIAEHGEIINRSDRLYLNDIQLLFHDIEFHPRQPSPQHILLNVEEREPDVSIPLPMVRRVINEADEELARAASLALLDYMRKSRSCGFTLSLSGGVDSAAVAVLVAIMAHRFLTELSPESRRRKLHYMPDLDVEDTTPEALTERLLTTVYQATRNSGSVTRNAASALSEAIGARHLELDVDSLVAGYTQTIETALGRDLTWEQDDIALQNIQARTRGPSVWMLANINRSLLLSTSNRSEVAVGYATMDGDTCGGLAPIAGVEKTFLRQWLVVMEREGLPGIPAIAALSYVNQQQPTAELRPPDAAQKDEDDLMPYTVLDTLESVLVAQRRPPLDAFMTIENRFGHQYDRAQLHRWTHRFCRLFATTQWKRERYAPAFHLDDRNLDPKTWARYPILSGAFAQELADLDAFYEDSKA